jgi:hypothetical protein
MNTAALLKFTREELENLDTAIIKSLEDNRLKLASVEIHNSELLELAGKSIAAQIELGFIDINDYMGDNIK